MPLLQLCILHSACKLGAGAWLVELFSHPGLPMAQAGRDLLVAAAMAAAQEATRAAAAANACVDELRSAGAAKECSPDRVEPRPVFN